MTQTDPIANSGAGGMAGGGGGQAPIPPPLVITPPSITDLIKSEKAQEEIAKSDTTATGGDGANGDDKDEADKVTFDIPEAVTEKHPDLVELVLGTKSMNPKEKQYWFHILPAMNAEQVEKLRTILTNEKQKLAEIDKKYSQKLQSVQEGRVNEWKGEEYKEKLKTIKEAEIEHQEMEKSKEEDLLSQLDAL